MNGERMKGRLLRLCIIMLIMCSSSCSLPDMERLAGTFEILSGVLAWGRHDSPGAIEAFMDARSGAEKREDLRGVAYADFGLASAYLRENELEAAEKRLVGIPVAQAAELAPSIWYQRGIVAYRKGDFDQAGTFFKRSLELDSSSLDAKVNLELSMKAKISQTTARESSVSSVREEDRIDQGEDLVFNLIRKKERDRWKNQEEQSSARDAADW